MTYPEGPNEMGPEGGLGGTPSEPDEASQLPNRINRYSVARGRALAILAHLKALGEPGDCSLLSPLHPAIASQKLSECGNWLAFHHYWTVGKVRLGRASFCKEHLLCQLCAVRRGAKSLSAYLKRFQAIQLEHPGLVPQLMTLTVKNGEDLEERFNHLAAAHRQLMKRRHCVRVHSTLRSAVGGVSSFEFTNKGNGWHPHIHAVVLAPQLLSQESLAREWETITGDSFIVDIRPFDAEQPVEHAFMEVFKYAVKVGELEPALQWRAYRALRGRRLLSSFGVFRGVEIPESLLDEPLDGLPYIEHFYRYVARRGYEYSAFRKSA